MDALWAEFDTGRASEETAAHQREIASMTSGALRSYADAGLSSIQMFVADDACPACHAVAGHVFAIADAPLVPIRDCGNEFCRCDYLPVIE
jgi:uncharacterized protein (UPF0212 family)